MAREKANFSKRLSGLKLVTKRSYEDNVLGKISDERFITMKMYLAIPHMFLDLVGHIHAKTHYSKLIMPLKIIDSSTLPLNLTHHDRGYLDYERFDRMTDDGYLFLSRLRKNAIIREVYKIRIGTVT